MKQAAVKNIIEVYGLIRLSLGTAQLTGLFFAYFLTEFLLSYPPSSGMNIISEGMTAGLFIAVFLRGIFHIIAGIGLSLRQNWVASFFYFAWPFILVVTFLLTASFARMWVEEGSISSFAEAFSSAGVLMYLAWAGFDCFVIPGLIASSQQRVIISARSSVGKMAGVILITLLIMGAVLFQNKDSSRGFYKGYYKARGSLKQHSALKPAVKQQKPVFSSAKRTLDASKPQEEKVLLEQTVKILDESSPKASEKKAVELSSQKKEVKGSKLEITLEVIGGVFLLLGLVLQAVSALQMSKGAYYPGPLLTAFGFAFWAGFGYVKHMPVLAVVCLAAGVVSLVLFWVSMKQARDS